MADEASQYGTGITAFVGGKLGMDRAFGLVRGKRLVAESVLRSWFTPRGSLITNPDAGIDLLSELSAELSSASALHDLRAAMIHEALRDSRVTDIALVLSFDVPSQTLSFTADLDLTGGERTTIAGTVSAKVQTFRYLEAA